MHSDLIRQVMRNRPIRHPSSMRLADGRELEVSDPGRVALGRRNLLHIHEGTDLITWITPDNVITLEVRDGACN